MPTRSVPKPERVSFPDFVPCVEAVSNGRQVVPSPRKIRRDGEDELDYFSEFSDYPAWVTDPITPVSTRTIPTASPTFTFTSAASDSLTTVSREELVDDVVSHERTATTAATTAETTRSEDTNVGAGCSSRDHTLVAFGLALASLCHLLA